MQPYCSKLGISNSRKTPLEVLVEPWAFDYTLMSGEELQIVAFGESNAPYFNLTEWDDSIQVWCEATDSFQVMQGDRELECGHQRRD